MRCWARKKKMCEQVHCLALFHCVLLCFVLDVFELEVQRVTAKSCLLAVQGRPLRLIPLGKNVRSRG